MPDNRMNQSSDTSPKWQQYGYMMVDIVLPLNPEILMDDVVLQALPRSDMCTYWLVSCMYHFFLDKSYYRRSYSDVLWGLGWYITCCTYFTLKLLPAKSV